MTNETHHFLTYNPCPKKGKATIANGSSIHINGKGSVSISPSLPLNPILHVPKIACNLLSISKVTKSLNCCVTSYPTHCIFQDLATGKKIGNAEEREGLYYLTPEAKKTT